MKTDQLIDNIKGKTNLGRPQGTTTEPSKPLLLWGLLVLNLILAIDFGWSVAKTPKVTGFAPQAFLDADTDQPPLTLSQPLNAAEQASVHGATLTQTAEQNDLLAAWYGGSREGAKDVQLFFAKKPFDQDWQPAQPLIGPKQLERWLGRHIKKVGNPVLYTNPQGRVWLFFVSVSLGGWAGSALNVMVSDDGGASFSPPRRLTTSPFFNVSTLARNRPVSLANGGLVLPIYHEFIGKFCELLWLDADGNIQNKQRLTWGRNTLQPTLVVKDRSHAAVFMRIAKPKTHIEMRETRDGGKHFSPSQSIGLPNSNAAIDASITSRGQWLLVYNHDSHGRDRLSIATAPTPAGPWQQRTIIDRQGSDRPYQRFSYPVILQDIQQHDRYHLLYTVERTFIQYRQFNLAWLDQQLQQPQDTTNP